ncbi:MAG: hypothetical protein OXH50_18115 [Gemmatimonadetes bacterium]|nr:hypothetical protein [Gemmatimonadota bacterium]
MASLQELHAVLNDMMASIAGDGKEGEVDIAGKLARIDALGRELGTEAPPMLRHFLEKRSYAKALDFLEGIDQSKAPNCR